MNDGTDSAHNDRCEATVYPRGNALPHRCQRPARFAVRWMQTNGRQFCRVHVKRYWTNPFYEIKPLETSEKGS